MAPNALGGSAQDPSGPHQSLHNLDLPGADHVVDGIDPDLMKTPAPARPEKLARFSRRGSQQSKMTAKQLSLALWKEQKQSKGRVEKWKQYVKEQGMSIDKLPNYT